MNHAQIFYFPETELILYFFIISSVNNDISKHTNTTNISSWHVGIAFILIYDRPFIS